jgi:hypothetical protein
MRNFFLGPQSQLRNLKEGLPQLQFRNFLRNLGPQLQFRNNIFFRNSQLQVRNFFKYYSPQL